MKKIFRYILLISVFVTFQLKAVGQSDGLYAYHNTLGSSEYKKLVAGNVYGWWVGGSSPGITNVMTRWYNGSTYVVGDEDNTTNQRAIIIKQTNFNLNYAYVGTGLTVPDSGLHALPSIIIDEVTGYVYVIQVKEWVGEVNVFKSDYPELENGGVFDGSFTLTGTFDTDASYLYITDDTDISDVVIITRMGDASDNGYDASEIHIDLDNPASYTQIQLTEGDFTTNQVRHYVRASYFRGTSTYRAEFIVHRLESTGVSYKTNMLIRNLANNVVYNVGLTASKDVVGVAPLTTAELEADWATWGTDATKTVWNLLQDSIQIDDDIYVIMAEPTGNFLYKYNVGTATPIETLVLPWTGGWALVENDSDLLLLSKSSTKMQFYSVPFDLSSYTAKQDVTNFITFSNQYGMPRNFYDINGRWLFIGDAKPGENGIVPYVLTKEKFN